jgi:hypothetical protein
LCARILTSDTRRYIKLADFRFSDDNWIRPYSNETPYELWSAWATDTPVRPPMARLLWVARMGAKGQRVDDGTRFKLGSEQISWQVLLQNRPRHPVEVVLVIDHPPYHLPGGKTTTQDVERLHLLPLDGAILKGGWLFSPKARWEWVPGTYHVTYSLGGQTVARLTLTFY